MANEVLSVQMFNMNKTDIENDHQKNESMKIKNKMQ